MALEKSETRNSNKKNTQTIARVDSLAKWKQRKTSQADEEEEKKLHARRI
jgi:hypothetical protein